MTHHWLRWNWKYQSISPFMLCDNVRMLPYLWKAQFQAITNEWMFPRQTGSEETGHVLAHTSAMKEASPGYLWAFLKTWSCEMCTESWRTWLLKAGGVLRTDCLWFMEAEDLPQAESLHLTWAESRCCLGGCCCKWPFLLYLFSLSLRPPLNDSRVDGPSVCCSPGSPALLCYNLSWNLKSE